jgi:hypothetical protein
MAPARKRAAESPPFDPFHAPAPQNPWTAMDAFLRKHAKAYGREEVYPTSRWNNQAYFNGPSLRASIRSSVGTLVLFKISVQRTLSGEIARMLMRSIPPKSNDRSAISLSWRRQSVADCDATIQSIAASPTQGLGTGNDSLKTAIAICRSFGTRTVTLIDESKLSCARIGNKDTEPGWGDRNNMSLRHLRILTKGEGWYESHGFKCIEQILEPKVFKEHTGALKSVSMAGFRQSVDSIDKALRRSVLERTDVIGKLREHERVGPMSLRDVLELIDNNNKLIRAMDELKKDGLLKDTLSETLVAALPTKCELVAEFVTNLFAGSNASVVKIGGDNVPPRPHEESWAYAQGIGAEMFLDLQGGDA